MYVFSFVKDLVYVNSSKYFTFLVSIMYSRHLFQNKRQITYAFLRKICSIKCLFFFKLFYYILKLFIEISIPKKGNSKECSNYHTIALISHARKVMLKILEARLQSMWNKNFQIGVQAGFRKGRGTRNQIANICWIMKKARESQKNICFCLIDYSKAFDCGDHNKLWKILKEMGIPGHLNCLLRNQHGGQEAVVRTRHGKKKNQTWNNRMVPNWERNTSRLYIVTLPFNIYAE